MSQSDSRPAVRIKLYVVEDQPKVLKNQLKLLEGSTDVEIVGAASSGEAAIEEIRRVQPEVILLDLGLPKMGGIDLTRYVKATWPKMEILIFTVFDKEENVLQAVRAGASGYLLKGVGAEKIVDAIKEVHGGGAVIQPTLARGLLRHFLAEGKATNRIEPTAALPPPVKRLSPRETEILQLIAKGVSNPEAARMLQISKTTIRTHLDHIYQKLDVTNRVEAVTEGIRKGLIDV